VKAHQWFQGFDWNALEEKQLKAPYIPPDGNNFDEKYA
jgi:hypothetical protein